MTHQRQCKLTVIRKAYFEDLAKDYAPVSITCPCQKFEEGQTFILDQNGPQGYWHLMGGTFCQKLGQLSLIMLIPSCREALFKQIERKTIGLPVVLAVSGRSSLKLNY